MGLVLLLKVFLKTFHAFCFSTASDTTALRKGKCEIGTAWRQPYKTFRWAAAGDRTQGTAGWELRLDLDVVLVEKVP